MTVLDHHLPLASLSDVDLDNLLWFGLRRAIAVPCAPRRRPRSTAEMVRRLHEHLHRVETRLRARGVEAEAWYALREAARPLRFHDEFYDVLAAACHAGDLRGVGPVEISMAAGVPGSAEARAIARHIDVAASTRVPILFEPCGAEWPRVESVVRCASSRGVTDVRLSVHCAADLREALHDGVTRAPISRVVLAAGPSALVPEDIGRILLDRWSRHLHVPRVGIGSSLRGSLPDVTAMARTLDVLERAGLPVDGQDEPWGRF